MEPAKKALEGKISFRNHHFQLQSKSFQTRHQSNPFPCNHYARANPYIYLHYASSRVTHTQKLNSVYIYTHTYIMSYKTMHITYTDMSLPQHLPSSHLIHRFPTHFSPGQQKLLQMLLFFLHRRLRLLRLTYLRGVTGNKQKFMVLLMEEMP